MRPVDKAFFTNSPVFTQLLIVLYFHLLVGSITNTIRKMSVGLAKNGNFYKFPLAPMGVLAPGSAKEEV